MEYIRRQAFKDGKHISNYNFFTYDLLIIIVGMRVQWTASKHLETGP